MILIIGGAYQGKLAYTLGRFNLAESDVYKCCIDDAGTPNSKKIIYEIDKWIYALVKKDIDIVEAMRQFIDDNQDAIVICNNISCGVVPIDPVQRKWREETGRALAMLSQKSGEVVRLFCGIPSRMK